MKKQMRKVRMVLVMAVFCILLAGISAGAAENFASYKLLDAGGYLGRQSVRAAGNKVTLAYNSKKRAYTVSVKAGKGKTKTVSNKCITDRIVTNGRYIYYVNGTFVRVGTYQGVYRNRVLTRYDIKRGKTTAVKKFSGTGFAYDVIGGSGKYLYLGYGISQGASRYNDVYVMKLANKSMKRVGGRAGNLTLAGNKLVLSGEGYHWGGHLYIMNQDGTGCRLLAELVSEVKVTSKYIFYTEVKPGSGGFMKPTRQMRTDLNGENKVALTGWQE